jgi:23S rRNA (guanosine2251-2'-O)-methyltransferase
MPRDRAPRGGKPASPRPSRNAGAPARGPKPTGGGPKPAGRGPARSEDRPSKPSRFGGAARADARPGAGPRDQAPRPAAGWGSDARPAASRPRSEGEQTPRASAAPRGPRREFDNDERPKRSRGASSGDRPDSRNHGSSAPRARAGDERPTRVGPGRGGSDNERPSRVGRGGSDNERPARVGPGRGGSDNDRPIREDSRGGRPERGGDRPARGGTGFGGTGPRSDRSPARPPREAVRAPRDSGREQPSDEVIELDEEMGPDADVARNDIIFGRHPAQAALEGSSAVNKVWVLTGLRNQEFVAKVRDLAKAKGATVQMVEKRKLDALTFDANHQGIVVSLAMASYVEIEEVIAKALAQPYPAILMLDGMEDPHNLGALVRSAEGADFAGVIISSRRQVGLTPTVAKSSAGALSRVPVARVGNLSQAAATLKAAGFWLIGADSEGEHLPYEVDMARPIALVIGGEGKGLGRLLAQKCDWRVKLPLGGELESLNASVAGGVLMYEAVRQRWVASKSES